MQLATPALLFPAISLLLLAYTNRFLVLAQLVREMHGSHEDKTDAGFRGQIENLRTRIYLIKLMQALGVTSFLLCSLCMLAMFFEQALLAKLLFGASLFMLVASLLSSLYEIIISTRALELELDDCNR